MVRTRIASTLLAATATLAASAQSAHAQSSVELAGLISAGLNYASNVNGKSSTYMGPAGVQRPNSLVFRGTEDLGGDLKAYFLLSSMFNIANGTNTGGPGSLFSRESYVGMSKDGWGSIQAGSSRDFLFDLSWNGYTGAYYAGIVGAHQGPFAGFGGPLGPGGNFDLDRLNGEPLNNSIKFNSANYGGFTFGAMYGFGGVAGSFGANASESFGANFSNALFGIGAAYTSAKYASMNAGRDGIRNAGIGGNIRPGPWKFAFTATWSQNTQNGAQVRAYDTTVGYNFTPTLTATLTYTYMNANAVLKDRHANQLAGVVIYNLSRRTSVYAEVLAQNAAGVGALAQINGTPGASSSRNQTVVTFGIQNLF
ncbi:porin [Paraburkholderia sp. SIMBA_049]